MDTLVWVWDKLHPETDVSHLDTPPKGPVGTHESPRRRQDFPALTDAHYTASQPKGCRPTLGKEECSLGFRRLRAPGTQAPDPLKGGQPPDRGTGPTTTSTPSPTPRRPRQHPPQSPLPLPEAETLFLQNGNRSFPSPRKPPDPSSPREHVHPPARHTGKRDYSWSPSLSNVIDQWEPERNKFIHLGFLRRKTFSPDWSKFLYWLVHTFFFFGFPVHEDNLLSDALGSEYKWCKYFYIYFIMSPKIHSLGEVGI